MKKEIKIEFAPGAFDGFEGTQEELDELMEEVVRLLETGQIFEDAQPVEEDDPIWEMIQAQQQTRH